MMYPALSHTIAHVLQGHQVGPERREQLQPLIDYIQEKVCRGQAVDLNFICTHNSRRSHLAQVWAETAAIYFGVPRVTCYSGGTEATALFPKILDTLIAQGFTASTLAEGANPIYGMKCQDNARPIIGFSKVYDSPFNPATDFAAVLTCTQADEGCPFIAGAEKRISLPFEDPKQSDGTAEQCEVYAARSLEIAAAMFYVFSKIKRS
ncbi:arsenate-mycothiol transferase ArsC [Sphingobacterium psychroaquaticum]|uniref:Arsenate reductase n=1 Tax=Sphingobacterium psychroaquaticum TaxID=561061 RepID=A0A1X7KSZ6_9SPHI|nr:protein-tyrosine-phosphatase [Sphingobacterium psychroaquaticum]SMG44631.1 arsenate reductase [Sphingobacterium psychroaquaticum]